MLVSFPFIWALLKFNSTLMGDHMNKNLRTDFTPSQLHLSGEAFHSSIFIIHLYVIL